MKHVMLFTDAVMALTLALKVSLVKSFVYALPGANPEESRTNLYDWIDLVAKQYLPPCAFVKSCSGEVEKGMYHQLRSNELQRFIGELAIRLQDWGEQCIANQKSCGSAMQPDGKGGGKVTMTQIMLGPFRGR